MKLLVKALSGKTISANDGNVEPQPATATTAALVTVFVVMLLGWQNVSEARIYKCVAGDGSISYSQSECSYDQKTAKVMSSAGRGRNAIDCTVAEAFIIQTSQQMRSGTPSGEVFSSYGGLSEVSSTVVSMVNYIYTFSGNLSTTTERVNELAMQSCSAGTFGVPTCRALPAVFVNEQGGCSAIDGSQSTASSATTSAENERERRRATRRSQRQAALEDD